MSELSDINDRLNAAADKAEAGSQIIHDFANGDENEEVTTESGNIPSLARLSKNLIDSVIDQANEAVSNVLSNFLVLNGYSELRSYSGDSVTVIISQTYGDSRFDKVSPVSSGYIDDGGITIISGNGSVWVRQFSGPINIDWFSPINDGSSSDSVAINSALLANHNRGGGSVVGDKMLWRLGETLHIGKNTSLFLNSKARLIRGHLGDVIRNDIGVTSSTSGYDGNGNIEIWGGQWEGNPQQFYSTFTFCQIGNADGVTFKHSTFLDAVRSHVFDLSAVRNVLLEDCKCLGFAGAASGTEPTPASAFTEAVQIDPNVPSSFPFGARDGTVSSEITLRRFEVGPNPNQADSRFGSWGCAIGQHGSFHNQFMKGIRIYDSVFDGITYSAIRGIRWVDVWIERNRFINCKRGVHVTPIPYNSSSANTVGGAASGVGQTGRNWNLKGNVYDGFTDNAIVFAEISAFNTTEDVFFHEDIKIAGETFKNGANNSAIALRYCSGAKVGQNRYENVLRGVDLDCSKDSSVMGGEIAGVLQQFAYIRENYLASSKPSPSSKLTVSGITGSGVGFEFVRVDCPAKDVNVLGNDVADICKNNNSLAAVSYYGGAVGGLVVGNTLRGFGSSKPSYGLYVNATCAGVSESSNIFEYSTQPVSNMGLTKPPVSLGPVCMDIPQIGGYGTGTIQIGHWVDGVWSPKLQISSAGNVTPVGLTYNLGSSSLPWAAVFAVQLRTTGEVRFSGLGNYANDAAAAAGGVSVTGLYRNGSALMVRVA